MTLLLLNVPHFDCPLCLQPDVQRIGPGQFLVKAHEILFHDSKGIPWRAPIDTVTDGGSIGWIIEPIVGDPIDSEGLPAFVLHDRAYQLAPAPQTGFWASNQSWERREADRMLHEACLAAGMSRQRAWLIYHGVRLGGWRPWRRHAAANAKKAECALIRFPENHV